ncbi:MAG: hypothetical protein V5A20_07975 [Salinibacter sp.]|uniref:hypothetical protein n=1 Tax=Salinibacter sp. TaxID=2065818 RepID=UPI002FC33D4F
MSSTAERTRAITSPLTPSRTETELLLVDRQGSTAVEQHPEIVSWRMNGWRVRSAEDRVLEKGRARVLVVLEREPEDRE